MFSIRPASDGTIYAAYPSGNELAAYAVNAYGHLLYSADLGYIFPLLGCALSGRQFAGLILANDSSPRAKIVAFELLRLDGYPPVIDILSGRASVRWYRPDDVGFAALGYWDGCGSSSYPLRRSSATVGNSLPAPSLQGDAANPAYPVASAWGV